MQNRIKNAENSPFSHCPSYNLGIVFNFSWDDYDKALSLTWLVSMQNYWDKRKAFNYLDVMCKCSEQCYANSFFGEGAGGGGRRGR